MSIRNQMIPTVLCMAATALLAACGGPETQPAETSAEQQPTTAVVEQQQPATEPPLTAAIEPTASAANTPLPKSTDTQPVTQPPPTETVAATPTSLPKSVWTLTAEHDALGPEGVSPEAIILTEGRVRLYVTAMGMEVWESDDGVTFEKVPARTPPGADPTLLRTENGWRMYYTEIPPGGPDSGKGSIRTATSSDGLDWVIEAETGIAQENDRPAWGVPDSFVLADGRVRVMWTDMLPGERLEVLRSATSADGVSFSTDAGVRLSGGFVDSYVLPGAPGHMLVSTSPPGGPVRDSQRLFLATSEDGLKWVSGDAPLLDRSPRNALDPTAVSLGDGRWRVYYALTDGPDPVGGHRIASAILEGSAGGAPDPTLPAPATAPLAQPTSTQPAPVLASPCEASEFGVPGMTEPMPGGLYYHQLYRAFSSDAFNFTPENLLLIDHASVPDAIIGPDGETWVYYVNGDPEKHGIFAARQTAAGTWEAIDCVRIDGEFNGDAVDPDVVRLPDGRYRLFFYEGFFTVPVPQNEPEHPIFSAISEDGLNFSLERQLVAIEAVTDPSAARLPDGSWLLALPQQADTLVLPSADGYSFDSAAPVRVSPGGVPELAVLPDGRVRLYYNSGGGIGSYLSSDSGKTWQAESGLRIEKPAADDKIVADPSLLPLPDGSYALYYKIAEVMKPGEGGGQPGQPPQPAPGEQPLPPLGGESGEPQPQPTPSG